MAETPNLHLAYSDDADTNRNWEILDATIRALGLRQVIPDNVLIQGDLEVTGNATIDGLLTAAGVASGGSIQGSLGLFGGVNTDDLQVTGTLTLPVGSLNGAWLAPGAAVQTAASSVARASPIILAPTTALINALTLDSNEQVGHWALIVGQLTLTVSFGSTVPVTITVTVDLQRGGVVQQTRIFKYTAVAVSQPALDIPVTIVRVTQIASVAAHDWSLYAAATLSAGSSAGCSIGFAQVHALQLR